MLHGTTYIALFDVDEEGTRLLGQTDDTLIVEAVRSALLIEHRAAMEALERPDAPQLRDLLEQEMRGHLRAVEDVPPR